MRKNSHRLPKLPIHAGLQWPCRNENDPGTEMLHAETFARGKTAALRRVPYRPTTEITDREFPFVLNTGRTLYHFNAGTMTRRTPNRDLLPTDYLDISVKDAAQLQVQRGESLKVRSRYGEAVLTARIDSTVKRGQLFATFHDAHGFINRITSNRRDGHAKTPEYKLTAVSISKVAADDKL